MDQLEFEYGTHCSTEYLHFYSVLLSGRFHSSPILVNYKTVVAHKETSYMSLPAITRPSKRINLRTGHQNQSLAMS